MIDFQQIFFTLYLYLYFALKFEKAILLLPFFTELKIFVKRRNKKTKNYFKGKVLKKSDKK